MTAAGSDGLDALRRRSKREFDAGYLPNSTRRSQACRSFFASSLSSSSASNMWRDFGCEAADRLAFSVYNIPFAFDIGCICHKRCLHAISPLDVKSMFSFMMTETGFRG